jgi:hypothetical protein
MRPARAGSYHMVDPSAGTEIWTQEDVDVLWRGQGIRLVRRRSDDLVFPLDQIATLASGE